MAAQEKPIRDVRSNPVGVYFDVLGARIQSAIREKINDRLDQQIAGVLKRLDELLPDKKTETMALLGAIATMKSPDDLAPHTAEVFQLCRHLQALTDEVAELQQVGRNLYTDEIYRLGIEEVKRFGL